MALRTILKKDTDEESLRKKSRPVTVFDQRLHNMIDDMVDTLKDSGGVGLAAPQVVILRRIVVIEKEDGTILELVNPEIIDTQGEQEGLEGCLSFPDQWAQTVRPYQVTVQALDENGQEIQLTGEGELAQCFCHELDHLDGIVFLQRAIKTSPAAPSKGRRRQNRKA